MIFPQQLQCEDFRFVLIRKGTKAPFEYQWQNKNNYKFNDKRIERWDEVVGIVEGYGGLVVIDIDDEKLIERFDKSTNTFTVKTGSGKRHYYFICKEGFVRNYYVLGNKQGELRVSNCQVVAPGSFHPSGNKYVVEKDLPIKTINKEELKVLLNGLLDDGSNNRVISDNSRSGVEWGEVCDMINGGYNFDDCNAEMELLGYSRWCESNMDYKVNTYCNALKKIKGVR